MKLSRSTPAFVVAVFAGTLFTIFAQRQSQQELKKENDLLRRQIAASNSVKEQPSNSVEIYEILTPEEKSELLRLRSEVENLRSETNQLAMLEEKNRALEAWLLGIANETNNRADEKPAQITIKSQVVVARPEQTQAIGTDWARVGNGVHLLSEEQFKHLIQTAEDRSFFDLMEEAEVTTLNGREAEFQFFAVNQFITQGETNGMVAEGTFDESEGNISFIGNSPRFNMDVVPYFSTESSRFLLQITESTWSRADLLHSAGMTPMRSNHVILSPSQTAVIERDTPWGKGFLLVTPILVDTNGNVLDPKTGDVALNSLSEN